MIKLEEGEKIVLEGRKHWFIAFTHIFGFFVSVVVPFVLLFILRIWIFEKGGFVLESDKLFHMVIFFCFVWALFMWMLLFVNLTNYYLDVWRVTSNRLVDIEQKGLFHRDEATLRLENIQDVAIVSKGIIQILFGFGSIRAQTAGQTREFIMRDIANPQKVKEIITLEQGKIRERAISVKVEKGNL